LWELNYNGGHLAIKLNTEKGIVLAKDIDDSQPSIYRYSCAASLYEW
jgi:hypothetical protein